MIKTPHELHLYDDRWISKTKDNMPTRSLFKNVFKEFDEAGSIYLDILRKWFNRFPLSTKQKRHMKSLLESYDDKDHLGAVNELTWYEFMKSIGLDSIPLPTGKVRKPDFEVTNPLKFFCEVTTLNISKRDEKAFEKGKSISLEQEKSIARIIGKILNEKMEQIKYGTNKKQPNLLVIFDYSAWAGLGIERYWAFANYLFGKTCGFKVMPDDLSAIIYLERAVLKGHIALNLKQSAGYINPFAKHVFSDKTFQMIRHYERPFREIHGSSSTYLIIE
jgi:hypothetical protein